MAIEDMIPVKQAFREPGLLSVSVEEAVSTAANLERWMVSLEFRTSRSLELANAQRYAEVLLEDRNASAHLEIQYSRACHIDLSLQGGTDTVSKYNRFHKSDTASQHCLFQSDHRCAATG